VPSEDLSVLRVGATVDFNVRGYERSFQGRIERISPQADATTRQVPIYVAIPNVGGRLVAGLFAEGRVVSSSAAGLIVPIAAVNTTGPEAWVLRVAKGSTERVPVTLGYGIRGASKYRSPPAERGRHAAAGSGSGISPGTPVKVAAAR